jgi:hypothetical protein
MRTQRRSGFKQTRRAEVRDRLPSVCRHGSWNSGQKTGDDGGSFGMLPQLAEMIYEKWWRRRESKTAWSKRTNPRIFSDPHKNKVNSNQLGIGVVSFRARLCSLGVVA